MKENSRVSFINNSDTFLPNLPGSRPRTSIIRPNTGSNHHRKSVFEIKNGSFFVKDDFDSSIIDTNMENSTTTIGVNKSKKRNYPPNIAGCTLKFNAYFEEFPYNLPKVR